MEASGTDHSHTTGAALESHYRFLLWLIPALERLPRSQKFLLGDRIQGVALDVLESLIKATYTRQRTGYLAQANFRLPDMVRWPQLPESKSSRFSGFFWVNMRLSRFIAQFSADKGHDT